ncbi:MAG: hypothetical protein ACYDEV_18270, partial [Acidiferrobacter sp.]
LKHGLSVSFTSFSRGLARAGEHVMHERWRFCFAYERLVDGFAQVFGDTKLHCLAYTNPIDARFLKACGFSQLTDVLTPAPMQNEALPGEKCSALRRYNRWAAKRSVAPSKQEEARGVIIHAVIAGGNRKPRRYRSIGRVWSCRKRWAGTRQWLRDRYHVDLQLPSVHIRFTLFSPKEALINALTAKRLVFRAMSVSSQNTKGTK